MFTASLGETNFGDTVVLDFFSCSFYQTCSVVDKLPKDIFVRAFDNIDKYALIENYLVVSLFEMKV